MLMRKKEEDIPSMKKRPLDMSETSSMSEERKEEGSYKNEREAAAADLLDAIRSDDPSALVDAFRALSLACEDEEEDEESESEEEDASMGEDKKPKDLVSIILAKKKPS